MLGELRAAPGATVVTLHGELDILTVEELRGLMDAALGERTRHVVVDLTDVPFVDILSLSVILASADAMRERGDALTVAGASGAVRRICALLNATDVLAPPLPTPRVALG